MEKEADFKAANIKLYDDRTEYDLIIDKQKYKVSTLILGNFNVYNTLAAITTCILLGLSREDVIKRVQNLKSVSGRLDKVENDKNVNIIVDYAHTPDALLNILKSARLFTKNRIILVFGCGGNRDKAKRPIMGKIAQQNADISIITSDNPRLEKEIGIELFKREHRTITLTPAGKEFLEFARESVDGYEKMQRNLYKYKSEEQLKIIKKGTKVEEIKVASSRGESSRKVSSNTNGKGKHMSVVATAYTGHSITSTGKKPKWGTIAVDPKVIPYGTKVYIPQFNKTFIAEDCGGAIKGNKIDIFMNDESSVYNWGRKTIDVYIVN